MPDGLPGDRFLREVSSRLHHRFGIGHTTIQIEREYVRQCAGAPTP
jgi:cobalt-zinc-cadmium efflux system protein